MIYDRRQTGVLAAIGAGRQRRKVGDFALAFSGTNAGTVRTLCANCRSYGINGRHHAIRVRVCIRPGVVYSRTNAVDLGAKTKDGLFDLVELWAKVATAFAGFFRIGFFRVRVFRIRVFRVRVFRIRVFGVGVLRVGIGIGRGVTGNNFPRAFTCGTGRLRVALASINAICENVIGP